MWQRGKLNLKLAPRPSECQEQANRKKVTEGHSVSFLVESNNCGPFRGKRKYFSFPFSRSILLHSFLALISQQSGSKKFDTSRPTMEGPKTRIRYCIVAVVFPCMKKEKRSFRSESAESFLIRHKWLPSPAFWEGTAWSGGLRAKLWNIFLSKNCQQQDWTLRLNLSFSK